MSGLGAVVGSISRQLSEGPDPGRIATTEDYKKWLAEIGKAEVQRLASAPGRPIILDIEGEKFELRSWALTDAWKAHCRRMGWVDKAFETEAREAKAMMLADLERQIEAEEVEQLSPSAR
jgi:hypothetical protein